ncbi:MAG: KR domain-containing protein, partial [Rhodospirillum sp.]|nr:KR domain-containing protein [Rhodospirillum sp.]
LPAPQDRLFPKRARPLVVITGGFGGVGTALARDFAREPGLGLLLLGRAPLPDRAQWDPLSTQDPALARKVALIQDLEALGTPVLTATPDLSDPTALRILFSEAAARFGAPISAVIHAAGIADHGGVAQARPRAETEAVLAPKLTGTRALEEALKDHELDAFVLCSTLGSILPGAKVGQLAYAAANEALDTMAGPIARRRGWPVVAINWDDWVEQGMTVAAHEAWGLPAPGPRDGMTNTEGAVVLRRILASGSGSVPPHRIIVSTRDPNRLMALANGGGLTMVRHPVRTTRQEATGSMGERPSPPGGGDPLEWDLVAAFQGALDDPSMGPESNFFAHGGHSLLAMRLLADLRRRHGVSLGIAVLFDNPTPRSLARCLHVLLASQTEEDRS